MHDASDEYKGAMCLMGVHSTKVKFPYCMAERHRPKVHSTLQIVELCHTNLNSP